MRVNLRIVIMGLLMPAFNIVYANHVVNNECYIKVDMFNQYIACEQGVGVAGGYTSKARL